MVFTKMPIRMSRGDLRALAKPAHFVPLTGAMPVRCPDADAALAMLELVSEALDNALRIEQQHACVRRTQFLDRLDDLPGRDQFHDCWRHDGTLGARVVLERDLMDRTGPPSRDELSLTECAARMVTRRPITVRAPGAFCRVNVIGHDHHMHSAAGPHHTVHVVVMKAALTIPARVIAATTSDQLATHRERATSWRADKVDLSTEELSGQSGDTILADLAEAATATGDGALRRVVESVAASRLGKFGKIPAFRAAPSVLVEYLRCGFIDGWVYRREQDGHLHPYLVVDVEVQEPSSSNSQQQLRIRLRADNPAATSQRGNDARADAHVYFSPSDVAKKTPAEALLSKGLYKETEELKADHLAAVDAFQPVLTKQFAEQFRFTGSPLRDEESWRVPEARQNRKVINDTHPSEVPAPRGTSPTVLLPDDGVAPVPVLTRLRVFDLGSHDYMTVNARDLTAYEYDPDLRERIILPADQRELLDILTTDIDSFTGDIIEGKSSGNTILAKGKPGLGKTLTAEVYSEVIKRPLYSIHSGSLGITAPDVRANLEKVFKRSKRWNAVLLLDEADVFVLTRGDDLQQNAIVAEFLRTLEYFDGLLFMTTNRADDIDDAILSRCAAIIDYRMPDRQGARQVWLTLAKIHDTPLPKSLVDELTDGFEDISPRDMKMLLRLAMRVAASRGVPLSIELFAQCAMFRGLHYRSVGAKP